MRFRPFAATRPKETDAAQVASVPYDVVDLARARELAKGNAKSFLHVSRPEIDLPDGTGGTSPAALKGAKAAFDRLLAGGVLAKDATRRYYAYRQTREGRAQTGIVGAFDAEDYENGVVKRHELTRKAKEDERLLHIETLHAQTGPAFLAFRDGGAIAALAEEARGGGARLFDFTAEDGVRHEGWIVAEEGDARATRLAELFEAAGPAYIADGHHRTAAAARYAKERGREGESRRIMGVAFPADELTILPYNRLVKGLNGLSKYEFMSALAQNFEIGAKGERNCRMYFDGAWYGLSWSAPADAGAVRSLDASYLQDNLLAPVLGIGDPRTDARISFEGGVSGEEALKRKVDRGEADVAFSMEAVTMDEIMAAADAGETMPPKSTWFEPKLRSGLFIHSFA